MRLGLHEVQKRSLCIVADYAFSLRLMSQQAKKKEGKGEADDETELEDEPRPKKVNLGRKMKETREARTEVTSPRHPS